MASWSSNPIRFTILPKLLCLQIAENLPELASISKSTWKQSCLSRPSLKWFVPPVVAPPIILHCMDRSFLGRQQLLFEAPLESIALYGLSHERRESEKVCTAYRGLILGFPPVGLITVSPPDQLPPSTMQVPEAKRLIYDSAKLARLDSLLQELKADDHRVLIYFQMTRMMDLMEEYLIYRQYKYLRLDGSSKLEDRRDMVIDWQTRLAQVSCRSIRLMRFCQVRHLCLFAQYSGGRSRNQPHRCRYRRLLRPRLEPVHRCASHGQSPQIGPDSASYRVPAHY